MWNQLKAATLATVVNNPKRQSPEDRDEQDARQIDDAQRYSRSHVLERVDDKGAKANGCESREGAGPDREAAGGSV